MSNRTSCSGAVPEKRVKVIKKSETTVRRTAANSVQELIDSETVDVRRLPQLLLNAKGELDAVYTAFHLHSLGMAKAMKRLVTVNEVICKELIIVRSELEEVKSEFSALKAK
jgi:hypothetical protein